MASSHDATFYVQLAPDFYYPPYGGDPSVREIRATALTQKRPRKPQSGTVMVKLTVRVPDAAFLPLRPEAIVVVPEDMTVATPLEVIAEEPTE
jgi:hypothetical protein